MRGSLLFLVFSVICCLDNATGDSDIDVAGLLKIGVRFVLLNLKHAGKVTLTDSTVIDLPEDIKNISIGSLKVNNAYAYGFEGLEISSLTAENLAASSGTTKTNTCLKLIIPQLGLSSLYDADIGILNEVPLYGDGELNLAASKINLDLCLNLITEENYTVLHVEDLVLHLTLHDSVSYITGFWKSDEVSDIVTLVINVLEQLICMFISYENDCVSCVASQVVQYVANSILPNNDQGDLNVNCDCLKAVSISGYGIEETLEKLVTSYFKGVTYSLTEREIEDLKELLEELLGYILQILREKGLNI